MRAIKNKKQLRDHIVWRFVRPGAWPWHPTSSPLSRFGHFLPERESGCHL